MIPKELADQVRTEIKALKEVHDQFLHTYQRICVHNGGAEWRKGEIETLFHVVRKEIIPIMEQVGMEHREVQALCAWVERSIMHRLPDR
jgi:hypothetical protein